MSTQNAGENHKIVRYSYIKLGVCLFFAVLILIARLGYLQFAKGPAYTAMAQSQRLKTIEVSQYSRGDILDRNGEKLTNHDESCLVVFPTVLTDKTAAYQALLPCALGQADTAAGKTVAVVGQELAVNLAGRQTFVLARNLTEAQVAQAEETIQNQNLQGVFVLPLQMRYDSEHLATHIIGFVGEADEKEASALERAGLSPGTRVGKTGIEKQYNQFLQGKNSDQIGVVVDERGKQTSKELRLLPGAKPQTTQGQNVVLTINKEYQRIMDQAMAGKVGGAVLLDIASGDVLAMTSAPGFDPEQGQPSAAGDVYLNKALAYYPPASVFKLVLVLAALENNVACPEQFVCTGSITLPNGHRVGCWYHQGHGVEDLTAALANSCNPYFVTLGQTLGGERILEYAHKLGLTEQTLIGYPAYSMPNNVEFNSKVPGDVANVSIGEKGVRLTPLLVAQLLATIANDGKLITPRLVEGVQDQQGHWVEQYASAQPRQVVQAASAKQLQHFLAQAVLAGTGTPVSNTIIDTAGKSGTSQDKGVWFAGFAPVSDPKWALAVYISNGDSGGKDSGGVFKEIMEKLAILEGIAKA